MNFIFNKNNNNCLHKYFVALSIKAFTREG